MLDLGVRLMLLIGDAVPTPASYDVVKSIVNLEVRNETTQRDTFSITFSLGRERFSNDFALLTSGAVDAPRRVIVVAIFGVRHEVLIDGIITRHQTPVSNVPGQNRLVIFGESIDVKLDLEERNETYENRCDSMIVTEILSRPEYTQYGLLPMITPTTDIPLEVERIPSQQGTDLHYIRALAERNGFVFYIEPSAVPGTSVAYWGLENRIGLPQPALTMNMGSATNVESFTAGFNTLAGNAPQISIVEQNTGLAIQVPISNSLLPRLAAQPETPQRSTIDRGSANLNMSQAVVRALTAGNAGADAADANGVLDAASYGQALRARRLVGVRGAGASNDGFYYVKQVTHSIKRGEYKQRFSLAREGRGTSTPVVGGI